MAKILEFRPGGGFNGLKQARVTQIADNLEPPKGAVVVADDAELTEGWIDADGSFVAPKPKPAPAVTTEAQ